jgi:hypothetical protein
MEADDLRELAGGFRASCDEISCRRKARAQFSKRTLGLSGFGALEEGFCDEGQPWI